MEWDNNTSDSGKRKCCDDPEKGGKPHSYPELDAFFEKAKATPEEREATLNYVKEMLLLAFEHLKRKNKDD